MKKSGKNKKKDKVQKSDELRSREFSGRQKKLIDCYDGDIKRAAKKANISYGYARQLLTKSNILEAIRNRQNTEVRPKDIADRQERQAFWSEVMRDSDEEIKERLRASELLGKSEADFTDNIRAKVDGDIAHGVLAVPQGMDPQKWLEQAQKVKETQKRLKQENQG